jgi:hypothetical protein
MTIARNGLLAGCMTALAIVAGCQSSGPGGTISMAPKGVEGQWMSPDGVATSRFSGGVFETTASDTGNKLAEGSYLMTSETSVQINGTSLIRQTPVSFNCLLVGSKQLNCTSSDGKQFTLVRRA